MSAPIIEIARLLNEARRRLQDRRDQCEFPRCKRCRADEAFLRRCIELLGPVIPEGQQPAELSDEQKMGLAAAIVQTEAYKHPIGCHPKKTNNKE